MSNKYGPSEGRNICRSDGRNRLEEIRKVEGSDVAYEKSFDGRSLGRGKKSRRVENGAM